MPLSGPGCELPKRVKRELLADVPPELLSGRPSPIPGDKVEPISESFTRGEESIQLDVGLIDELFKAAADRGESNSEKDSFALDRWLSPRLHLAIRVPRRIASDRAFWAWIAMRFGYRYVHERFSGASETVNAWRFTGDLLRNGVSRLWWAAELLRNGPDYSAVDLCLRRVVTAQYALELKYSWFRPAAIAFTRLTETAEPPLSLSLMTQLSVRANAYLPLCPIEALGYDSTPDTFDSAWWTGSVSRAELLSDELPGGPTDGAVSESAITTVEEWFLEILEEIKMG